MRRRAGPRRDAPLLAWGDALRAQKQRRQIVARRGVAVAGLVAILLGSVALPPAPRLLWNVSASAPIGLYLVSPGARAGMGDFVIARLPEQVRDLAARRRYLPANVPLVKRVAAVPGDDICANGRHVRANGRIVAERRIQDGVGRALPSWSGCRRLRDGQLLLLMDSRDSFDGRYFGATSTTDYVGKAQLLWAR